MFLCDFYGRLFQDRPKYLSFLGGCIEESLHKYYIEAYGEMQNTHDNSPQKRKSFFNLFWACFSFEFASFVPETCLAESKPSHIDLALLAIQNIKITSERVLFLIKFEADVLQNSKNSTPPDQFMTFCEESNNPKSKNASCITQKYTIFFLLTPVNRY